MRAIQVLATAVWVRGDVERARALLLTLDVADFADPRRAEDALLTLRNVQSDDLALSRAVRILLKLDTAVGSI